MKYSYILNYIAIVFGSRKSVLRNINLLLEAKFNIFIQLYILILLLQWILTCRKLNQMLEMGNYLYRRTIFPQSLSLEIHSLTIEISFLKGKLSCSKGKFSLPDVANEETRKEKWSIWKKEWECDSGWISSDRWNHPRAVCIYWSHDMIARKEGTKLIRVTVDKISSRK